MEILFESISECQPGIKWRQVFERLWPAYQKWFLKAGERTYPTYLCCEQALRTHMPEILSTYQQVVELAGGGDQVARFLSLYNPAPYMTGCSQAVWTRGEPLLIRNYDYAAQLWEAKLMHTQWNGKQVIAMSDCLWGVLDGMNENGLAVSLAFGGRKVVGDGFGIPLILRYILEICDTTSQAVEVLDRVPSHMAYNVSVVDRTGASATVFVAPDRSTVVTALRLATNHQGTVEWTDHAMATSTLDRAHFLKLRLLDDDETRERFVARFLNPPLYQTRHEHGWGTLYTSTYDPVNAVATCRWPSFCVEQSFSNFVEQTLTIRFG